MISRTIVRYLATRIAYLVVMYFVTLTILFMLPRLIPANPILSLVQDIYGTYYSGAYTYEQIPAIYRSLVEEFGYGKPLWQQYIDFLSKVFRGDLGTCISSQFFPLKVNDVIATAIPWTLLLLVPSTIVGWYIGNTWGARAGYKRGSNFERASVGLSMVISQIPEYWFAMLLIFAFAVYLGWFPLGKAYSKGYIPNWTDPKFILDVLWHYALPFIAVTTRYLFAQIISMRNLIIYELRADYLTFSDSLGVPDNTLYKYAFRNAMMPQVVNLAIRFGRIIAGQAVIETLFSYPGMGYYLAQAISNMDYMLLQGIFVILVATVYIATFLTDFIHALIDPRVRLGYATPRGMRR
ncbi:MAG: ABC transporter permease [Ignisphaera sp.]